MPNRYAQVLRTYWRRSTTSLLFAVCIFPQLLLAIGLLGLAMRFKIEQLLMIAMVVVFISGPIWMHFREQIVDERRRLWPQFIGPHVVIFSILAALLAIVWPGALILRANVHSVGILAFATAIMAFVGLWVLNPQPYLFVIGIAGCWFWVMGGVGQVRIEPFFTGGFETAAMAILAGSVVVIGWTIFRMAALTEENAVYHRRLRLNGWDQRPRMTGDGNQVWMDAQRSRQFGWLRTGSRIHHPTNAGLWQGARRWLSLSRGNSLFFLFMGICVVGSVELVHDASHKPSSFPMIGMWLCFMPTTMVFGSWLQRWRFLETELLRPIDRESFLKQIGLAIAINVLQAWSMTSLVFVFAWFIFERSALGWPVIACVLGASLMIQVLCFGALAWTMQRRSSGWLMAGILPAAIFGGFVLAPIADQSLTYARPIALMIAALMGAMGIAAVKGAYRCWLVTEIGA